jgi:hypothetical protein
MLDILRIAWVIVWGVLQSLAVADPASAQNLDALYQARAVVTGQSGEPAFRATARRDSGWHKLPHW